jgi:anti-sigma B factor antagonist
MLNISETKKGSALVVNVSGRVDSATSPELEQRMNELIQAGERTMVLNLSQLTYISSAGLRVFLSGAKKLRASGGKLLLCSLTGMVKEVFMMSGFYDIMAIYESEDKALSDV